MSKDPSVGDESIIDRVSTDGDKSFGEWQQLLIGDLELDVLESCERCVAVNVHPLTGERSLSVLRELARFRLQTISDEEEGKPVPARSRISRPATRNGSRQRVTFGLLVRLSERTRQTLLTETGLNSVGGTDGTMLLSESETVHVVVGA